MIWQSKPSIVVGKHQNTYAEINYRYIKNNHIRIARRLSGGGTVYHDEGNINFTFIFNGEEGKLVDFKRFVAPVIKALNDISINVQLGDKNELVAENKKISGNAEHVFKKRVLHHGTLLFNVSMNKLKTAIKISNGIYKDKAVKSNRSEVINIQSLVKKSFTRNEFVNYLFNCVKNYYNSSIDYCFNKYDLTEINKLKAEKYTQWDWIFGYSPKYSFNKSIDFLNGRLDIDFNVEKGEIVSVRLHSAKIPQDILQSIKHLILGCKHSEDKLIQRYNDYSQKINIEEKEYLKLVSKLF